MNVVWSSAQFLVTGFVGMLESPHQAGVTETLHIWDGGRRATEAAFLKMLAFARASLCFLHVH